MLPLEQSSNLKGTFVSAWILTCPKHLTSGNTPVRLQLLKCSFPLSTSWQSAIAVLLVHSDESAAVFSNFLTALNQANKRVNHLLAYF